MTRFPAPILPLAALFALAGPSRPAEPDGGGRTVTLTLTGTEGARFSGYYVRGGQRVEVEGTLPRQIREADITACEFRKADPGDTMVFDARAGSSTLNFIAGPTHEGFRANLGPGWSVTSSGYRPGLWWKTAALIAIPVLLLALFLAWRISRIRRAKAPSPSSDEKMRAAARRLGEHLGKKPPPQT